jgi:REP element-mobilizing transposase RayT
MARRLRIQYEGALYHIINRGNYRRDLFSAQGAAWAFNALLCETCARHGWRLHAYVVMRNHYHLALETPSPNLVEGMHWLQSTFGTRFNRYRSERGHLFQGRYQALLVEDDAALLRLVNYVHLNPVRAGEVAVEQLSTFRWSSLGAFLAPPRPAWLVADRWLRQLNLCDARAGWTQYLEYLIEIAGNPREQERQEFHRMSSGWAIGTQTWKRALAREYSHLALEAGWHADEIHDFKEARWRSALEAALVEFAKNEQDLLREPPQVDWKIELAARLRREAAAPYRWIARALQAGNVATLRNAVWRLERLQQATGRPR